MVNDGWTDTMTSNGLFKSEKASTSLSITTKGLSIRTSYNPYNSKDITIFIEKLQTMLPLLKELEMEQLITGE